MQYFHKVSSPTIVHLFSNQLPPLLPVAALFPGSSSILSPSSRGICFAATTGQLFIAM